MSDLAVGLRDLAQLVRPGRRPEVARQLGRQQDEAADLVALGGLEREQAAHPVADHDDARAEPLDRRDDVVGVGVERERRRIGGLRPEVVAQVERVALPAAPGEVAEVALPEPRPGELAVEEQERPAARSALGQPRLDVQAALDELDLVLADGPAGRRRRGGRSSGEAEGGIRLSARTRNGRPGSPRACYTSILGGRGSSAAVDRRPAYHSCGLMTSPVTGLG